MPQLNITQLYTQIAAVAVQKSPRWRTRNLPTDCQENPGIDIYPVVSLVVALLVCVEQINLFTHLHIGDPNVIQTCGLTSAWYSGFITCKFYSGNSMQLKAYYFAYILAFASGKSMCNGHMRWGSHEEVQNSYSISAGIDLRWSARRLRRRRHGFDSRPRHVCLGML